jgi:hypothetical protein
VRGSSGVMCQDRDGRDGVFPVDMGVMVVIGCVTDFQLQYEADAQRVQGMIVRAMVEFLEMTCV